MRETTKNSRGPTGRQARGASVFQAVAGLAQTRLTVLSEITGYVDWLFMEQPPQDERAIGALVLGIIIGPAPIKLHCRQ